MALFNFKSLKKKLVKKKNMSWSQAKARYPKLSPFGDADKDGVKNWLDCKPFDRKRQENIYMIYDDEREYGLVKGREEEKAAKASLRIRDKKGVGSFEWDNE